MIITLNLDSKISVINYSSRSNAFSKDNAGAARRRVLSLGTETKSKSERASSRRFMLGTT